MASARPNLITSNAVPMAWADAEQAVAVQLF
jgi:hypothetical protein